MSDCSLLQCGLNIHPSGVLTVLFGCYMEVLLSQRTFCVHHTTMHHHFMQSHIRRVQLCFVIPCHLHFWQYDWDFLHATVVTQGWNRYWHKSQHRKLTLVKKILSPLLPGLKPAVFDHKSGTLTTELSLLHLVGECSSTVISACYATVDWSLAKKIRTGPSQLISTYKKKKRKVQTRCT